MRREVLKHINMRVLRKVSLFFGCDAAFTAQLCHVLTRTTFIPSEEICRQGDIGRELYFMESGRIQSTIEPPDDECDSEDMADWHVDNPPFARSSLHGHRHRIPLAQGTRPLREPGKRAPAAYRGEATMALSRAPKSPMPVPALAVQEDWEFDLRERERINKTSMRMYREAGTTLCGLAFLFGLRQEATLKAIKKTNCLMLPRDEWIAIATEFPGEIFKVRERALVQAKDLYGDSGDLKDLASHVTKEVEAIMAKKGNALYELMLTAAAGDEEAVKVTLNSTSTSNAVGVNDADFEGRTALHLSASKGLLGMVRLLLDANATPTAKDNEGRTPLQLSVVKGHGDVSKVLRNAGATLGWDEFTTSGELCEAAKSGNLERLELMLACGANVNSADCDSLPL